MMLTPFERNLEVWRQLWRVLERSDIVVQVRGKQGGNRKACWHTGVPAAAYFASSAALVPCMAATTAWSGVWVGWGVGEGAGAL